MITRAEIDALYDAYERLKLQGIEALPALRDLYPRTKAAVATLDLQSRFHKIFESTSGPAYNLRFFASPEVSIALTIRAREHSFYDDTHLAQFDIDYVLLAAYAMNLRLRVDYAIDDLQEAARQSE